jgi:ribonuclease E
MKKEMLINVLQPEECRIAIVEDGVLEDLYVERSSQESYVGNIYKGRIVNIEPSIQAAFVDFGIGRNGFLHVSDVDPAYYKHLLSKEDLAEYEAEMNREYGGGGRDRSRGDRDRDRDRGPSRDRGPRPQPMTSWLEPQPSPSGTTGDEDTDDFSAGIGGELPAAGLEASPASQSRFPVAEEVIEAAEVVHPTAEEVAEDQDFAAGLDAPPPLPQRSEAAPASRARPPVRGKRAEPRRKPALPEPVEDDDFGAGLVDEPAPEAVKADVVVEPAAEAVVEGVADAGDVTEPAEAVEPADTAETEAEPKARKPRGRRSKAKAEEAPAEPETPEQPAEAKGKPKGRRTRKKADGEADAEGDSPDDKQKYMGGAERRTTAGDEPEVRPFFDDSSGFDPDAPNDRFADVPAEAEPENGGEFAESDTEEIVEEAPEAEEGFESPVEVESEVEPEPESTGVGRGFNDDFEDARPSRRDRDRDRDRGPRGRGRDRDRDRPRGGRDRDRDRGPRNGGFKGGRDRGLPKPKIEQIFKRGQEVLVQVIKEAVGTKGPTLSTYISIAGRYLVLMPSLNRVGVSRKIEDHDARRRLREIMTALNPPKGVGFIVRTAAVDRDAKELRNDLMYLLRLWQVVVKRIKRVSGPVEIYRESDMITRTIRDIFTNDIDTIWVDEATAFAHASEFLQIVMPKYANRIRFFESHEPLFHKYGVEEEIAKIHQKRIEMPLGGSLVIEQTEALVAIDVNSGNFRADNNAEETAFQMNLHAAKEIARQLRLRDLGGVIVNDFIDMRSEVHRRKVEDALREALRRDRARTKILRISQFGLIEMTRQRIRPSLKRSIFSDCPHCRGSGFVKTSESLSIDAMRLLQLAAHRSPAIATVQVGVHIDVAHYLLNKRRKELAALEERGKLEIQVTGQPGVSPDTLAIRCFDHNGNEVRLLPPPPLPRLSAGRSGGRGDRGRDRDRDRDRGDRERRYPQPLD